MKPLQIISQVSIAELGWDCPPMAVDICCRITGNLGNWLQRRGRVSRVYPAIAGDRSYQTRLLEEARKYINLDPTLTSPCGSGKGELQAMIAASCHSKGRSATIVTPRRLLVSELSNRLTRYNVPHGVTMPGFEKTAHPIQVVSMDTATSRNLTFDTDLLMIDEAHTALSEQRMEFINRHTCRKLFLTASPTRGDGKGLGRVSSHIIQGPSIRDLQELGFLVPCKVYSCEQPDISGLDVSGEDFNQEQAAKIMNRPGLIANAVKEYIRLGEGLPGIVHASSVAHSKALVERFNQAGIPAAHIDADSTDAERNEVFERIKLSARPKKYSILLDCSGNVMRMGLPDDDREWSLEDQDGVSKKPTDNALTLRRCEDCFAVFRSYVPACPECGRAHVATGREIKERNEALVEYQRERKTAAIERYQSKMTDEKKQEKLKKLIWECAEKQHKPGSLFIKYKLATAENLPEKWKPTVFGGIATIGKYRTACSQLEGVQGELLDKVFAKEQFNPTPLISSAKRLHIETEAYKNKLVKMNLL